MWSLRWFHRAFARVVPPRLCASVIQEYARAHPAKNVATRDRCACRIASRPDAESHRAVTPGLTGNYELWPRVNVRRGATGAVRECAALRPRGLRASRPSRAMLERVAWERSSP